MTAPRLDILNINFYDWAGERLYRGGAERYVLDLAGLARGIGLVPRILQNAWQPFTASVDGIEVVGIPTAKQVDFQALSAGFAPHVEGAALVIASPLELACALPAGAPVIGISHGIWWDDPTGQLADPDRERRRLHEALARVTACVCVDTNFINWVRTQGDPAQPKLEYVPNCVALDRFPAQAKSFAGPLRVLFPRRLCSERGFPGVLEAFDYLLPRHPDLEFHLCGGGAEREEVLAREFVARHRDRARWSDLPMDEMPSAYAASHVVLLPTEYGEGTSLACIEAMATNNAVVATHVGGLPNLVLDGYNGLLIKPGPQALVDAVERLVADRALTARLAAHALDVASSFGRARWQQRWLDLMGRSLGRTPGSVDSRGTAALPGGRADASAAVEPAQDAARLALSLADAMASRDSLADAMRLVAQERDAARRHRERMAAERDAARADADLARRERSLAVAEAELERRERALVAANLDYAISERAAARTEVAAVGVERDALAAKLQDAARLAIDAAGREDELRRAIAAVEQGLATRDEGIVWLRDELKLAYDRFARRRASVKLTGVDFAYAIGSRFPRLKRVAKALVPKAIRRRFNRASAEQQGLASPPAAAATAGAAPAGLTSAPASANAAAMAGLSPASAAAAPSHAAASGYDVICFANIEWSARYQRPQHMMSRFADDGHRVFYVIASRAPPPGEAYAIEPVAHNVFQVCLAVDAMQDFYGKAMSDGNEAAMADAIAVLARDRRIKAAITVVHLPYWARLAERLRERRDWRIVYDCMDEWADFPAIGRELLVEEERLVRVADLVTVTAALLEQKWKGVARNCMLVRNGVDFDFFARHCTPNGILEGIKRPIVGYYGALADWVDLELIAGVARRRPDWNFVLLGDIFVKDLAGLDALPNVQLLGRRPYQEMPKYLYHFDVCLVPFKLNDVTHAVDPVKFYEYISAGKPVVAVPLKEMEIYGD
jgi:glycosyltransferase involved in cell wall biosynthesis